MPLLCSECVSSFNSRTREGCDINNLINFTAKIRFNSRTREGCDLHLHPQDFSAPGFQFTHPGGVRLPFS